MAVVASLAVRPDCVVGSGDPGRGGSPPRIFCFSAGWLLSSAEMMLVFVWSLIGGIIYRFATAERKSSFFKSAVALFVGKQVAQFARPIEKIGLTGKREMVTILFTDIRGFTAFCESKDPAEVVDLLNTYMGQMCRHHRQARRPREQVHRRRYPGGFFRR